VRAFTQTQEVFDGDQTKAKTENHIHGDKAPKLQPGKRSPVNTEPHRLPHDDIGIGGRVIGKAAVKEVNNGQEQASKE